MKPIASLVTIPDGNYRQITFSECRVEMFHCETQLHSKYLEKENSILKELEISLT
jgi:hypothetical protein